MLRYQRSSVAPPAYLQESEAQSRRAALIELFSNVERRDQTRIISERVVTHATVQSALLKLFHGKCAFCEARDRISVYRFRPPAEARPARKLGTEHLYYTWLADAWENLFPICKGCQPEDPDYFPVQRQRARLPTLPELQAYVNNSTGRWANYPPSEAALLLDPCAQSSFHSHLHPQVNGQLIGISPRGMATVDHFKLNRPERVEQRRVAFDQYLERLFRLMAPRTAYPEPAPDEVFGFTDLEFGGAWNLLLRRLARALVRDEDTTPPTVTKIGAFFMHWQGRPSANADLFAALERVKENDRAGPPLPTEQPVPRTTTARLTGVSISNFKGIERLSLRLSGPSTPQDSKTPASALLIIGENAACKSTILEAIALALSGPEARKALPVTEERLRLDPAMMGDDRSPQRDRTEVTLDFDDGKVRRLEIDARGIRASGRADLPPVFGYGAFRQYLSTRRNYRPEKSIITLFRTNELLSNPEAWLLSLEPDPFKLVVRTLQSIFAVEGEVDVLRAQRDRSRCVVVHQLKAPDGTMIQTETPLSLVSSGFRSILAMACDILQGLMDNRVNPNFDNFTTARGVVLIDEIEAHLHPRWKMQIMTGLRAALPQVTFIATTHDPLCLRGMSDGEVLVLHRIAGKETPKTRLPVFVEELVGLPAVSHLTVEQLLTSDFFSLYSTESPSVEQELSQIADLLARKRRDEVLNVDQAKALSDFESIVARSLPIGSSPVERIIQDAVAQYLEERRSKSSENLRKLEEKARLKILDALRAL
jgi:hypothetical protein